MLDEEAGARQRRSRRTRPRRSLAGRRLRRVRRDRRSWPCLPHPLGKSPSAVAGDSSSSSVSIVMAPVGQRSAQRPQRMQRSSSFTIAPAPRRRRAPRAPRRVPAPPCSRETGTSARQASGQMSTQPAAQDAALRVEDRLDVARQAARGLRGAPASSPYGSSTSRKPGAPCDGQVGTPGAGSGRSGSPARKSAIVAETGRAPAARPRRRGARGWRARRACRRPRLRSRSAARRPGRRRSRRPASWWPA